MGVVEVLDPVAPARAGGWKVDVSRGERNGRVSSEWFNRPDDERYLSLDDLWASVKGRSERSRSRVVQTADIRVEAARDNPERLHLMLPKAHEPVAPTHWAFGQLASIVGAPASYLRQLPAPLAGMTGAGRLVSLLDTTISLMGMEWVPLVSAVVTVARRLTWPPLLRTSTGSILPLAATEKLGAVPDQLTAVLLPTAGVVGVAGMEGLRVKPIDEVVPPGVGQAPSPRRKNTNLSI